MIYVLRKFDKVSFSIGDLVDYPLVVVILSTFLTQFVAKKVFKICVANKKLCTESLKTLKNVV